MSTMIKIRIKNADHEIDIRFPISESELFAKLGEIHAIEGKEAPQSAFVTEVYWPEEFSMLKDRFANLDELNYLAKRMESFDYHEYDQFLIGITKLENPTEKDLINLTFNLDHFTLCKDVSSYGKIGREYVMNTQGAVPANDEDDPKYAAIGKDLIDKGLAQITGKGLLIYNPFDELTEVYDGQTFPEYYHGKLYLFLKDNLPKSAILGSANLGVIKQEANNIRQYEVSSITDQPAECTEVLRLIRKMQEPRCSANIADITDMPIIREINTSLTGVDTVEQIPQTEVALYDRHKTEVSFVLPIKVPAFAERHMDDGKHYTKSNLNVSYAAPRSARKSRDWYETQFTVNKSITLLPGYPEKNVTFYVITDDGYTFKAHTTSDGNKQFSAVGDELILGRWIKGRLAAAGLVTPVNDTQLDRDRLGMITKEMLEAYGCDTLVLTKTDQKMEDEEGNLLDVWFLSFEAAQEQEDDE